MKKLSERVFGGKNKKKLMGISFLLVAVFLLLPIDRASAAFFEVSMDWLKDAFFHILFWFQEIEWFFVKQMAKLSAYTVDVFLDPALYEEILVNNPAIDAALATVRDFCYMFYIFFLLLVAFSTIVGSQAFSAKSVLPKLVISVFLINFSDVITRVIIDAGQVFLFGMAGWMGSFSGEGGKGEGLLSSVDMLEAGFEDKLALGTFGLEDNMLVGMSIIFTFMLASAYAMLTVFLLLRLVMFVFLIVASPAAFFGIVLPATDSWRKKWQSSLLKNVISGPVIIFFIYFSALMMQSVAGFSSTIPMQGELSWAKSLIVILIQDIIPLAILFMAVPVSQMIGATGAKGITNTLGYGAMGAGVWSAAKGTKHAGDWGYKQLSQRSSTVSDFNDKVSDYKSRMYRRIPFVGDSMDLKSRGKRAASKKDMMEVKRKEVGEEVTAERLLSSKNRMYQSLGLERLAKDGTLGNHPDALRLFGELQNDMPREMKQDLIMTSPILATKLPENSKIPTSKVVDEKVKAAIKAGKQGQIQGTSNIHVARGLVNNMTSSQLGEYVKKLTPDQKAEAKEGFKELIKSKDATDQGNWQNNALAALKSGALIDEVVRKSSMAADMKILLDSSAADIADWKADDLKKHGFKLDAKKINDIVKSRKDVAVGHIQTSVKDEIQRLKGKILTAAPAQQAIWEKEVAKLEKTADDLAASTTKLS